MLDTELIPLGFRKLQLGIFDIRLGLEKERLVRAIDYFALFVHQGNETHSAFDQVDSLLIVRELYSGPVDSFPLVLFLFQFENMLEFEC